MSLGALWGEGGEAASPSMGYGIAESQLGNVTSPTFLFPAQGLIPSLLLFTPRRLKRKIPSTAPCDSACLQLGRVSPSAKQELSSLAEHQAPQVCPLKILPPPHHAQGVLSENKKGFAAKASLTDTDLRLDFPLERLSGHPGAGPPLNREQGFPWILTRLHLDLADATSVLRSWASGPGSESTQVVPLASFSCCPRGEKLAISPHKFKANTTKLLKRKRMAAQRRH